MSQAPRVPVTHVLDEAVDCVRVLAAPWLGVLWLGVLPLRLITVHFVLELIDARDRLATLSSYLRGLAWLIVAACVLATLARAVFARACHEAFATHACPRTRALRLTASEAATSVLAGLAALAAVHATWFTVLALPLVAGLLGLALATARDATDPGLVSLTRRVAGAASASRTPLLVLLVLAIAWLIAGIALRAGTGLVWWMLGGIAGFSPGAAATFDAAAPHALLLYASISLMLVEPFWIATSVSYVRRLRASHTGEDLRGLLLRLAARRGAAAALLLALLAAGSAGASAAETLTVDEYRAAVAALARSCETGDVADAGDRALRLADARVQDAAGTSLPTDSTVLGPVTRAADADDPSALRACAPSLRSLAQSLDAPRAAPVADPALLRRLQDENARARRREGGALLVDGLPAPTLTAGAREILRALFDTAADLLARLLRWLEGFMPSAAMGAGAGLGPLAVVIGTVMVLLLVALLLLALAALRRRREPEAAVMESVAAEAEMDADPLARTVAGWERRAQELAAAGRLREAVRAWYHGVLATLYAGGVLHYRKGRTNWEYLAGVSPEAPWRPPFFELTSRFDREWYGLNATTADALLDFEMLARSVMRDARRNAP